MNTHKKIMNQIISESIIDQNKYLDTSEKKSIAEKIINIALWIVLIFGFGYLFGRIIF